LTFSRMAVAGVSLVLIISMDAMIVGKDLERMEIEDLLREW